MKQKRDKIIKKKRKKRKAKGKGRVGLLAQKKEGGDKLEFSNFVRHYGP